MEKKTPRWESELWYYLSSGDGTHCPLYSSCRLRRDGARCISVDEKLNKSLNEFIDKDEPEPGSLASAELNFPNCRRSGRIFWLVRKLANKFQEEARIDRPPVPNNLITHAADNLPIEVRQIPLKAYRGAVWKLSDCWVVQLNSNNSPARQRFTLFHEIFHILAHNKATPVFKKVGCGQKGSFNEILADHFSGACLLPEEWVKKTWPEVKDVRRMATIFVVPKPIVWFTLKHMNLI
jgi:Zn-dependent peptidase ImmA (M78 family)